MSTELTVSSGAAMVAPSFSQEQIDVIRETVAKGASNAQLAMFLELAKRYGLDPFAKEIWCVNMGGGMTVMASRDGYLKAAKRDPNFKGLKSFAVKEGDEFEIDPMNNTVRHKFGTKRGAILGSYAIAYHHRHDPVIVWAEFSEYNKGNSIWKNYPSAMIQKVAEVMALKRQFGINGLVSQEEIGTPEADYTVNTTTGEVREHPTALPSAPPAWEMTDAQRKRLFAIAGEYGVSNDEVKILMEANFGIDSTKLLTKAQYEDLCDELIPQLSRTPHIEEADYTDASITPDEIQGELMMAAND